MVTLHSPGSIYNEDALFLVCSHAKGVALLFEPGKYIQTLFFNNRAPKSSNFLR